MKEKIFQLEQFNSVLLKPLEGWDATGPMRDLGLSEKDLTMTGSVLNSMGATRMKDIQNKRDNLEMLVVIPVFIAPGMHTKIDIKAILNLIHENEKKNRSKPKNNNIKEIKINKIILEEDPDHAHKYDETVDFEGEILYLDPIGADDILIEILEDMVNDAL